MREHEGAILFAVVFFGVIIFGTVHAYHYDKLLKACELAGGEMIRNGKCYRSVENQP